jgi:hypothetical protein
LVERPSHICRWNVDPLPRCDRNAAAHLRRCGRRVARRRKGGNHREKALAVRAKAHLKVKPKWQDFHHGTTLQLARQHPTAHFADRQAANTVRNRQLAKSIHDAGRSPYQPDVFGLRARGVNGLLRPVAPRSRRGLWRHPPSRPQRRPDHPSARYAMKWGQPDLFVADVARCGPMWPDVARCGPVWRA